MNILVKFKLFKYEILIIPKKQNRKKKFRVLKF